MSFSPISVAWNIRELGTILSWDRTPTVAVRKRGHLTKPPKVTAPPITQLDEGWPLRILSCEVFLKFLAFSL